MKKSIVFGANGYIGRHLVQQLLLQNHFVVPIGRNDKSKDDHKYYMQIDITQLSALTEIDYDVDYIFIFAGIIGTIDGFDNYEEYIKINEIGLLNILSCKIKAGSSARIIFPSTRLVYKGVKGKYLNEGDLMFAKSIYALTKINCENILKAYSSFYGIKYTIFRICVVYGNNFKDAYSYGTVGFFLGMAGKGQDITLYGTGQIKRTFTHVLDICNIIEKSLDNPSCINQVFNIGSNDNFSLKHLADLIAGLYNVGVQYIDWPKEAEKIESGDTIFDGTKLQRLLDFEYKFNLEDWIKTIGLDPK